MNKKPLILIIALIVVVVNVILFASLYQKSLAPSDSGAATNVATVLKLTTPSTVVGAAVNSNFTTSLQLQNTSGNSVAELVFTFDPAVLTAVSINETMNPSTGDPYVLALNKNINSSTGRITVDIAKIGTGDLQTNTNLIDIVFTYKSAATQTVIRTDAASTVGSPNQLQAAGRGILTLKFIATSCGDGTIQTPNDGGFNEVCDNGTQNGVACTPSYGGSCQYCASNCVFQTVQGARCGDGVKQTQEQCDSGAQNGVSCTAAYGQSCNYCNTSCQTVTSQGARCGDSVTQTANGEQCDNGAQNGVACNPAYGQSCNYCNNSCQTTTVAGAVCGDGVKQAQEACDDSNADDYDMCSRTCVVACNGTTQISKGSKCISIACRADYAKDGTADLSDFSQFAINYKKAGITCDKDITVTNGTCYLDVQDFALFASIYKVGNACQ